MKQVSTIAALALALATAPWLHAAETKPAASQSPAVAARPWPHEQSDMKVDPRVTWGKLDNGLRYAILPTKSAPTRGSLRMLVLAGSGYEDDDQQGLAHFLEHMAFNGTKNFKPGEAFEYFQRLGMAFGAHTNAVTQIDHTVYQLDLPRANEELTSDCLKLFRDFLDGMLLDEKEIEQERGVVLSELAARNTPAYRSAKAQIGSALAGTKFADRLPLGTVDAIRNLRRERFVDFYETWYTPGRTVIVAAGDFDVAVVERLIRERFADARARRGETPTPDFGKLAPRSTTTARFNSVPDASSTTVGIERLEAVPRKVDNMADQVDDILDLVVNHILDVRFDKLSEADGSPIQAATLDNEELYATVKRHHFSAKCLPHNWSAALTTLTHELRRARRDGFSPAEIDQAKAMLTAAFQALNEQQETRQPDSLADSIVDSINESSVFSPISEYLVALDRFLPQIDKAACENHFNKRWGGDDFEISVVGNVELSTDAAQQILAAYEAAQRSEVKSVAEVKSNEFPFTDFGPAGRIVSRKEIDDLGVVQAVFANNVRVNVKSTPFEKGKVRTLVRFGDGLLSLPKDKPGLQLFANSCFISGGLKGLPLTELNRQIGDKNLQVMFNVSDDCFQIGGAAMASSLELQLQVCAAYLTKPAFRAETERQFYEAVDGIAAQRLHTLEGVISFDAGAVLRSNDPRFVFPAAAEARKLKLADVRNWLAGPLAEGYMEVTIVGDVKPEVALDYVAKTLGALPERLPQRPDYATARKLAFPSKMKQKTLGFASDVPRAAAIVGWSAPGAADTPTARQMFVLKLVLAERMRAQVREQLGATYSPSVAYFSDDVYPDFGFLNVALLVDPQKVDDAAELATKIAAELAAGSVTDDEFERAVKPMIGEIEHQRRDNGYWLTAISSSQERPTDLDDIRSKLAGYSAITKADIERLAHQCLTADRALKLNIVPTPTATEATAGR